MKYLQAPGWQASAAAVVIVLLAVSPGFAQIPAMPTATVVEVAAAITTGLEGPTADQAGNVYFTEGSNQRIWKLGTDGKLSVFRQPSNRANGLVFDTQFRLIAAEAGDPATKTPGRVTRTD